MVQRRLRPQLPRTSRAVAHPRAIHEREGSGEMWTVDTRTRPRPRAAERSVRGPTLAEARLHVTLHETGASSM